MDYQKGKYEVMTGTLKKLLPSRYCSDRSLEERVEEDLTVPGFSVVILKQTNQTTVSDMIEINRRMRDQKRITVFGTTDGESSDDSLADLGCIVHQNPAVGVGARFIKLGGLCRGERVTKYCRLLSIEDELAQQGALGPAEKHEFPVLTEETEADPLSQA